MAEQQKTIVMLRGDQSSLCSSDQRNRHRSNQTQAASTWKSPGNVIDVSRIRLTRQPVDENVQLGPSGGRGVNSQWNCSTVGTIGRTVSSDREQSRYFDHICLSTVTEDCVAQSRQ